MNYDEAENILQTYSLSDIFEFNELDDAGVLCLLVEHELIELPEHLPL